MQQQGYHNGAGRQGHFANPRVVVQKHRGAPLLNGAGLVIIRQLIERLGIAQAINAGLRLLRRHRPYAESDHILTLVYNLLSGGETLNDVNRLGDDPALLRVLGAEHVPHATTIGDFLARFKPKKNDREQRPLHKTAGGHRHRPATRLRAAAPQAAQGGDTGLGLLESRGVWRAEGRGGLRP